MKPIAKTLIEQISLLDVNKPVQVYRNLHRGMWSVRQGTVKFHTEMIYLVKCEFVVREKGRQRVLAEKRKNVHAFVKGYLWANLKEEWVASGGLDLSSWKIVRYDPYKNETFVSCGNPIHSASRVAMCATEEGCLVIHGD